MKFGGTRIGFPCAFVRSVHEDLWLYIGDESTNMLIEIWYIYKGKSSVVGWKWHIPQTWINYKCPVKPIWLDKMKISCGNITWHVSCFSPTEDDFGVIAS